MSIGIEVRGASEHNLKSVDIDIPRGAITVVTGVSGSGKSSLAFDTILAEAQRRFFYTLSHYTRQFLDVSARPAVKQIKGLSPAIALAQNETQPSRRATVGTLTDVSELFGVLFARFGRTFCPQHDLSTQRMEVSDIIRQIASQRKGETVAICAPIAQNKKGHFRNRLEKMSERGYSKVWINGSTVSLLPVPELNKESKHTIRLIVDYIKITDANQARLQRAVEAAVREAEGFVEFFPLKDKTELDIAHGSMNSTAGGCPTCGYSWPRLDSRYFSANSLGKCQACSGYGVLSWKKADDNEEDTGESVNLDQAAQLCKECSGTGLMSSLRSVRLGQISPIEIQLQPIEQLIGWLESLRGEWANNPAMMRVAGQIVDNLRRIMDVGLGYLPLSRRVRTLSGGESQRLKLAGVLGEHLTGILYVLDEPSQGLHPVELKQICDVLRRLCKGGNSILIVDHDETIMRCADWIVDLGPGGGASGGTILAKFRPSEAAQFATQSVTAAYLAGLTDSAPPPPSARPERGFIEVKRPFLNNLKMPSVRFKIGHLNVVTGVSGAGKSSLAVAVLYENLRTMLQAKGRKSPRFCEGITGSEEFRKVELIDRKPVAKSSISIPASYLDVLGPIRDLYASLPEAQIAGYTARTFSLHTEGGRCEECKGRGEQIMTMRFLPDARVRCDVCGGRRFRSHVLSCTYAGLSIADVLDLTIAEAHEHFTRIPAIKKRLDPALTLGLGYLKMGQPTASLSGGEAQRLKLVPYFTSRHGNDSILVIDEPTTGLHFQDVAKLQSALNSLVNHGATVVLVEHNAEMIRNADWVVDVGPGAAQHGGDLVYQGDVKGLLNVPESLTGSALKDSLH
jgi:excinuclease ABC subunit A